MRKMKNLELKAETIQISVYINIILNILQKHNELSLSKILFFSYLIKKQNFVPEKIYTAKNTREIVYKAISLVSGEYVDYCANIQIILKAIDLLIENKKVKYYNFILYGIEDSLNEKNIYQESAFIGKAIDESKKMSEKQFMKEVISNV